MPHISLVTLGVADLARASAFYEVLGWRRSTTSVEGTVTFFHGQPVLALFGRRDLAADARVEVGVDSPGQAALAMNVGAQDEVDQVIATAEAAGATITKHPQATDWGGYSAYFSDLDGHLWEVAHNPGFALLSDGRILLPDLPDEGG